MKVANSLGIGSFSTFGYFSLFYIVACRRTLLTGFHSTCFSRLYIFRTLFWNIFPQLSSLHELFRKRFGSAQEHVSPRSTAGRLDGGIVVLNDRCFSFCMFSVRVFLLFPFLFSFPVLVSGTFSPSFRRETFNRSSGVLARDRPANSPRSCRNCGKIILTLPVWSLST